MPQDIESFGGTATKLSQSPLGIIALFIVLVYGFAALVVGLGRNLNDATITPLIWFMVLFPVLVLGVFGWLVSRHHTKLYAPKDYPKAEHFLQVLGFKAENLNPVPPQREPAAIPSDAVVNAIDAAENDREETDDMTTPEGRYNQREKIYLDSRYLFLVHVLSPSQKKGQVFDIFIYIKRHRDEDIGDVAKAEFYFGRSWGNRIFEGTREGNVIGVSTSAYGPFLCTCFVTFTDGHRATLYRYVDFEMGNLIQAPRYSGAA